MRKGKKRKKLTKKERQEEKNKRQNEKNMHELRADFEKKDSEMHMERKTETDIDKFVNQLNQLLSNEQTYRLINDSLLAIQT